jgi:hypothetical protein
MESTGTSPVGNDVGAVATRTSIVVVRTMNENDEAKSESGRVELNEVGNPRCVGRGPTVDDTGVPALLRAGDRMVCRLSVKVD